MLRRSLQVFGAIVSFAMTLSERHGGCRGGRGGYPPPIPVLEDRYPERRAAFAGAWSASRI